MMTFMRTVAYFMILTPAAHSCGLDDRELPKDPHEIDGRSTPANSIWTWLHHNLALTQEAIRRGNHAHALSLANQMDRPVRVRRADLLCCSESKAVRDFHATLARLVTLAGGGPLKEIHVGGKEA